MKTFKKVLASALAAAMVVTAFPVANAEAATTAKLSATKATLYVGQSKTLKVTTPSTWKSVKVTATSSKKSVATVKKSGKKVTVKAVKAGTAKVTVKVTAKKAGKKVSKTLKATITVKNPTLTVKAAANELAVGETTTVKATTKPSKTVTFKSSDETIATVDAKTGVVTAVKAGTVKITATAGKLAKDVELTIKDYVLKDVKQTTTTKLVATIAGNSANVKASDIAITNTYSKANLAVKSVSVDKTDKSQVTIETYVVMADGKDYTVTLADVTKTFTATDGKITNATISPASVVVPTPASESDGSNANDLVAKFTDANGVEITSVKPTSSTIPTGFTYVEWKVDATNNGYLSGNILNLYKVGNSAKVTVIAHTGKYNASAAEEGNVTAEATITGVDPTAITTSAWNVKFGKDDEKATEFKNIKETKIAVKDAHVYAYVQRATSDGKTADAKDYTFESSNNDVMTVAKVTGTINPKATTAVKVTPYKSGTAYIIVKDSKNNVVTTLAVTIGDERKVTALTLDKNSFVLSDMSGVDATVTVKATAKDQYGEEVTITSGLDVANADPSKKFTTSDAKTISGNTISFKKPALVDGKDTSNTYVVSYENVKTTFTVLVKKHNTADVTTPAAFDLVLSADKADAIIKSGTDAAKITANIVGYDRNGVKVSENDTVEEWSLTKDGKAAEDANGATTGTALTINVNNKTTGKQMSAGIYTLTVTQNKKTFVKTFEVTNTQPTVSVERIATEGKTSVADCFKFTYEGAEQTSVKFYGLDGKTDVTSVTNQSVYVSKADVTITLGDDAKVVVTVNIGLTVTVK